MHTHTHTHSGFRRNVDTFPLSFLDTHAHTATAFARSYAVFECAACGQEVAAPNVGGRVEDPTGCAGCKKKWSMALQHNKGQYTDKQLVKMQVRGAGGVRVCV